MRIALKFFVLSEQWASTVLVTNEKVGQASGDLIGYFIQRQIATAICGTLYLEIIRVIGMKTLQAFHN